MDIEFVPDAKIVTWNDNYYGVRGYEGNPFKITDIDALIEDLTAMRDAKCCEHVKRS